MSTSKGSIEADHSRSRDIWIISGRRGTPPDLLPLKDKGEYQFASMYQISDLGRYLLNPEPIEIQKPLIGCKIQYRPRPWVSVGKRIRNMLSTKGRRYEDEGSEGCEELLAPHEDPYAGLRNESLRTHFEKIEGLLSPYSAIARKLLALDLSKVQDITGICDDLTQERTVLVLNGSLEDKVRYVARHLHQEVGVILPGAYIARDLFELRGFDFGSYVPERVYHLVRFTQEGKAKACVLDADNHIQFWITDVNRIRYLQLLEQSIQRNHKLMDAFRTCAKGDAAPIRLFFNSEIEIDYSESSPPDVYKEVFKACRLAAEDMNAVISSLSNHQLGISFSYVPRTETGAQKLYTCLSVMHNVRALESIKKDLPQLYAEIKKRAGLCEAGRFYLLDSAGGYQHAQ
jgi:hypothetical protein